MCVCVCVCVCVCERERERDRQTETERGIERKRKGKYYSPVLQKILRICVDSPRNKGKFNLDYGGYLVNRLAIKKKATLFSTHTPSIRNIPKC